MSTINNGTKQNKVVDNSVSSLQSTLYENIFNVNLVDSDKPHYFYNLLNKVSFPEELSGDVYDEISLNHDMPWTTLSYRIYGTIDLWWLIVLINKPDYIFMAKGGIDYRFIKPKYVESILSKIKQ
jgi:hypothetical protein